MAEVLNAEKEGNTVPAPAQAAKPSLHQMCYRNSTCAAIWLQSMNLPA